MKTILKSADINFQVINDANIQTMTNNDKPTTVACNI
jgi:hypothetical protein